MFVIILKNSREAQEGVACKCGKVEIQFPYKDDKTLIMLQLVVWIHQSGLSFMQINRWIMCVICWKIRVDVWTNKSCHRFNLIKMKLICFAKGWNQRVLILRVWAVRIKFPESSIIYLLHNFKLSCSSAPRISEENLINRSD